MSRLLYQRGKCELIERPLERRGSAVLSEVIGQCIEGHWPRKIITLRILALEAFEQCELRFILYALG